jgi:selenocysteine lyase/cysteine desulfurase
MPDTYREEFDIPRDVCYLNAAYMTPQPGRVLKAAIKGAERRANAWELAPADFFSEVEVLRSAFARQVTCPADNIAIVPSAGYGAAVAAKNIPIKNNGVILVLGDQFPSNYYSWHRLAQSTGAEIHVVRRSDDNNWTSAILESIDTFGERIQIAALEQHHWATGESIDLDRICPALRAQGSRIVLDLTQTIGAYPTSMSELAPDFVIAAAYKWQFCPYGTSFLYVADEYFDGTPIEEAWLSRKGAEDFSQLANYTEQYQPGARRFDAGERSSFSNISGAIAALDMINEWGIENISRTLANTNLSIARILEKHGFEIVDANARAPHFQSARLANFDTRALAARLVADKVFVSQRGDRLRLAPHLYTDQQDLDRFEDSLRKAMLQNK